MKKTIVDCVTDLFSYTYHMIDQLQGTDIPYADVDAIYTLLIRRARDSAGSAGIVRKKVDTALFAVVAWVDETILAADWAGKQEWANSPLQRKHFNTTNAGIEFFTKMESLKPDEKDILEVYDYCLASGFKGRLFESHKQDELKGIIKNLRKKLWGETEPQMPQVLFPAAGDTVFLKRIKRKRWRGMASFASVFVLLPLLLFLASYYFFDQQLNRVLSDIGL